MPEAHRAGEEMTPGGEDQSSTSLSHPQKVFVLAGWVQHEGWLEPHSVYSTMEKALAAKAEKEREKYAPDGYDIFGFELDAT